MTALPGISAAELDAMQTAAARFLGSQDNSTAIYDMQALREPADSGAAGKVSARRDTYDRVNGCHFMLMPYHAS